MVRRRFGLGVFSALLALSAPARAGEAAPKGEAAITLRWTAPAGCPDEAKVRGLVEELLGRGLDRGARRAFAVSGETTQTASGFELRLVVETEGGKRERRIADKSCARIARAAALVVEIAIEDAEAAAAGEAEPARDAPQEPSPTSPDPGVLKRIVDPGQTPKPARDAPTREVPRATNRPRLAVRASGGVDVGSLPSASPSFEGAAILGLGALSFEGFARAFLPERARLATGAGGDLSLVAGGARACAAPLQRRVEVDVCAAFEVGSLRGAGFGVDAPSSGSVLWLAPSLGVHGGLHLTERVLLRAPLEVAFPLSRPMFRLDGVGDLYRPAAVSPRFGLGLEIRLW